MSSTGKTPTSANACSLRPEVVAVAEAAEAVPHEAVPHAAALHAAAADAVAQYEAAEAAEGAEAAVAAASGPAGYGLPRAGSPSADGK
jgi:hypothetical protein